ncbi:Uncharacterised protein [Shigella sonnei]|nr:Uncharacterised protein [Shigella sonnei]CSF62706.1 Uncharacterised protein [Shigella sonnei]
MFHQFETQPGKTLNLAQDFWLLTQGDERRAINIDRCQQVVLYKEVGFLRQQINLLFHNLHPMADGDFSKIAIRRQALRRVQGMRDHR